MSGQSKNSDPEAWHVLVCGLPLAEKEFHLSESLILRRLEFPLTVFDLAAAGAVGFKEWATLEPLISAVTAEIVSPTSGAKTPGYDALNKCWLASALLVLRGFARHVCLATSAYSWNMIAGHQAQTSNSFRKQLIEEGVEKAVFEPRRALPPFTGGLLDYHLSLLVPKQIKETPFGPDEALWFNDNFSRFNMLAAESERFRFALEAAVDWRFAKDLRAAIARLWSGIESLFEFRSELIFRISLMAATVIAARGPKRIEAFKQIKRLYGIRSKAVHGEPLSKARLVQGVHESFDLLRHLLLDAVALNKLRLEEDFLEEILG